MLTLRDPLFRDQHSLQYADDAFLYSASENLEQSIKDLETNIKNVTLFFERHRLNINADKIEVMIFCKKKSHNHIADHRQLKVKNEFIEQSKSAKYLGVYLDQNLTYQMDVQTILRKMTTGIKVLYSIRNILPKNTSSTAEFASSKSSALLFYFDKWYFAQFRLTLEKQLSWAVKACFHKKKYDSSRDLKLQY